MIEVIDGDLIEQDVDVIVNAWNRNPFPWWLLVPQGVSRAIKLRAGLQPFRELAAMSMIPLGGAVVTSAGHLNYKGIIHVAGINLCWMSSEAAIRSATKSALSLAQERGYSSIAFPTIGAGTGGIGVERSLALIAEGAQASTYAGRVVIVRHRS